ncbi:hypothetical protein AMEX_G16790 [Astyanax mexicanus]|uniref:Uncharacterized protein n=1 Tax=Astyanax mexicanus TaxID=7994 RepID=A0A8T2LCK0_ASTMX|nr:hypothetical protein AMEX_G16790 [Astyanax mexicanus]
MYVLKKVYCCVCLYPHRYFVLPVSGNVLPVYKLDWIDSPPADTAEGDVECFSEYMELWIHRMRIEGLRLWLSTILRIQVSLTSLESLNHQLSACGFGLHKDPDRNYIFRVMYSGCFVQLERGHYVIALNLMKRISRFGGRAHNYVMKCPVVAAPPNREHIQCDPDFIQVTREIPMDSWNNELTWSIALRGRLVVALEDASLIQVNADIQKPYITVQGQRNVVLSPVQVLQTEGQFLPLKLVSGNYAYSMEATCPNVNQYSSKDTVLHIYKRRMGLTKRGGYENETLSVSSVSVNQTNTFTWSETSGFVQLIIPTTLIQKIKNCPNEKYPNLQQAVFRIDVILTFRETNNKMLWTMENKSPCSDFRIPSAEAEPQTTVKSKPLETKHTDINPTFPYSDTTVGPLISTEASFSMDHQASVETREEGFVSTLKSSQTFLNTGVTTESSVSLWKSSSAETDTTKVLNSTDPVLDFTGELNEQIPTKSVYLSMSYMKGLLPTMSTYVTKKLNMETDATITNSLLNGQPKTFVDLSQTTETTLITTEGPPNWTTTNRISSTPDNTVNKAALFTAAPSYTGKFNTTFKWNSETSPLSSESATKPLLESKRVVMTKTVSTITLHTQTDSLKPLRLHQEHTPPSPSPPQPDIMEHSTDTYQTASKSHSNRG